MGSEMCIRDSVQKQLPAGADRAWCKPFPDFTNGDMQRELAVLLAARPLPASSRKRPVGGGAHEACTGSVEQVQQVVNCRLAGETPPRSRA